MRKVELNALEGGITRLRNKGGTNPKWLYDLVNGYVLQDGSIQSRPGTDNELLLPAGTKGLCAVNGALVVFSNAAKTGMPAGVTCEILTHPTLPTLGLADIHFAGPFLGGDTGAYLYVVAEFSNGDVFHYWLQRSAVWTANTNYKLGDMVEPTVPNGFAYRAKRIGSPYPVWAPSVERTIGDRIEPTVANGFYYEVIATSDSTTGPTTSSVPGTGGALAVTGTLPVACVGIPWDVQGTRDPWRVAGGAAPLRIRGTIASGLQVAYGAAGHLTGVPLLAGAASISLTIDDRSGQSVPYTQALTVAPRPAYTLLDFSKRDEAVVFVAQDTAHWNDLGGILIYQGATAGLLYAEVTTATATSVKIGIHTGILTNHNIASGVDVAAAGTYAVAFNCTTGSLWVSNSAGVFTGDPAAGTGANFTGLPASVDGRFRLGFTSVAGGRAAVNCGNSAWAYTPPVGFSGWPVVAEAVPAIWDTSTASYAELSSLGWMGRPDMSGPDIALYDGMRATVGKSAGKWQFELTSGAQMPDYMQMGLCTSAFVFGGGYGLGLTGSTDSIGLEQRVGGSTTVVNTSFSSVTAATSYTYLAVGATWTFACDFTAGTVAIYRNGTLLHTVTGVPAGTWYPAGTVRQLRSMGLTTTSLAYPVATYSDWTETP